MAIMNERIKEMRQQHGYTLAYIADILGVTEATAQRYESGKGIKTIPYKVIEKYSNIFNCSPQYIMGWDQKEINELSNKQADASEYLAESENILKDFMVEISEMGFEPKEIEIIRKYARVVNEMGIKQSPEFNKDFSNLFIDMYKLGLSSEDLKEIYTYAQFIKSKKKG